jgi:hypothetical protein
VGSALYVDTSMALRATLERDTTLEIEARITAAPVLITSRLSLGESARALLWIGRQGRAAEEDLADTQRDLDALYLATFLLARRRIEGLELLTVDERLKDAASAV